MEIVLLSPISLADVSVKVLNNATDKRQCLKQMGIRYLALSQAVVINFKSLC